MLADCLIIYHLGVAHPIFIKEEFLKLAIIISIISLSLFICYINFLIRTDRVYLLSEPRSSRGLIFHILCGANDMKNEHFTSTLPRVVRWAMGRNANDEASKSFSLIFSPVFFRTCTDLYLCDLKMADIVKFWAPRIWCQNCNCYCLINRIDSLHYAISRGLVFTVRELMKIYPKDVLKYHIISNPLVFDYCQLMDALTWANYCKKFKLTLDDERKEDFIRDIMIAEIYRHIKKVKNAQVYDILDSEYATYLKTRILRMISAHYL